jgi:hypothetical protein
MAMAGDNTKVKMGAAWVYFGTVAGNIGEVMDLGYTKGGVSFTLETATHEITVDQEGTTPIAETIMGRRVQVNVPMAESNYERLNKLIPDSSFSNGLLEINSGVGGELMDYADELWIVSKKDVQDWIKLYMAAPVANIQASFTADGERIWPVVFKGYVPPSTSPYAGKIMAIHQAT